MTFDVASLIALSRGVEPSGSPDKAERDQAQRDAKLLQLADTGWSDNAIAARTGWTASDVRARINAIREGLR